MTVRPIASMALVLAAAVLGACATPEPAPEPARVTASTPTMKVIDAPGGDYFKVTEKIEGAASRLPEVMRVILTAQRLQPKDEWNPTLNFCIDTKRTGASACLHTFAAKDGSRLIARTISKASEHAAPVMTNLPFDLAPFDAHYLDIALLQDRLVMIIDDVQIMELPMETVPDEYWYSCSSVVCSVEVLYPYVSQSGGE